MRDMEPARKRAHSVDYGQSGRFTLLCFLSKINMHIIIHYYIIINCIYTILYMYGAWPVTSSWPTTTPHQC